MYPQRGAQPNPVMQANQYSALADIGGDTYMDITLAGDAVNGKFTVEPGEFAAFGEARSQKRRLQLEGFALFHTHAPWD